MKSAQLPAKRNGHGGFRPGSGRKKGGFNEKNRKIAAQAAEEGVTPMEVMLKNMRYYDERAESFDAKLQELADALTPEQVRAGGAELMEFLKLVAKVGEFRMKAQECAVDAAPYVHPRLAALAVKVTTGDSKKPPLEITQQMTPKVAADAYAEYLAADE